MAMLFEFCSKKKLVNFSVFALLLIYTVIFPVVCIVNSENAFGAPKTQVQEVLQDDETTIGSPPEMVYEYSAGDVLPNENLATPLEPQIPDIPASTPFPPLVNSAKQITDRNITDPLVASVSAAQHAEELGTPGVYTFLDAIFGRYLPSVQVLGIALLLGGGISRLVDNYVFRTADRIKEEKTNYDTAMALAMSTDEESLKCELSCHAIEQQIAIVNSILSEMSGKRGEVLTQYALGKETRDKEASLYSGKFNNLFTTMAEGLVDRQAYGNASFFGRIRIWLSSIGIDYDEDRLTSNDNAATEKA